MTNLQTAPDFPFSPCGAGGRTGKTDERLETGP